MKCYFRNVHSHGDQEQKELLTLALRCGIGSIEIDTYLVDGKLLASHDEEDISPEKTVEELYFKPLKKIYDLNKGYIYNNKDEEVFIHIDFKTDTKEMWDVLQEVAKKYDPMFTKFNPDGSVTKGAITIFTSSYFREPNQIAYSTFDGRFGDIFCEENWNNYFTNSKVTPIVSSDLWKCNDRKEGFKILDTNIISELKNKNSVINTAEDVSEFLTRNYILLNKFVNDGKVCVSDYLIERLKTANEIAKKKGVMIRFWNSPDTIFFWEILKPLKNIMINTDKLEELRKFLTK